MSAQSALAQDTSASLQEQSLPRIEAFDFTGTGREYFRIWIVNLLLTMVTLGIYSAWAKVRKLRYFYGSTHVAGGSFEYHGDPLSILKGRLIAIALLILYTMISEYSMVADLIMLIPVALILPWLLWKSLQFKLYNSSYRGIRFGFGGSAGQAYWHYLVLPILTGLSLYLLTPFTHQRIKKFQHSESRFGTVPFSFDATVGSFYKAYLKVFLVLIAGSIAVGFLASLMVNMAVLGNPGGIASNPVSFFLFGLVMYLALLLIIPLFMTMIQNLIWSSTRLQGHQFACDMTLGRTAFIMATNLLGIIFTLGLYTPFAQIRMMKYRIESMTLVPAGSLDDFVADTKANTSASSEGMADLLDFDLSL